MRGEICAQRNAITPWCMQCGTWSGLRVRSTGAGSPDGRLRQMGPDVVRLGVLIFSRLFLGLRGERGHSNDRAECRRRRAVRGQPAKGNRELELHLETA